MASARARVCEENSPLKEKLENDAGHEDESTSSSFSSSEYTE